MGYIVVGTGRCGTSTVARVLHEKLGVRMGKEFMRNEMTNQGGTYEDKQIWSLNRLLFDSKITYQQWFHIIQIEIQNREETGKEWGMKDPMLSYFLGEVVGFCREFPKIIWCKRDKSLVLRSMQKNWMNTAKDARTTHNGRFLVLERLLAHFDHLVVDFGKERLSDEEIVKLIKGKWGN